MPLCASKAAESASPRLTRAGDVVQLAGERGILLDLAEHLNGAEDGQAGADEGEELLIEDEEWLELDFAAANADGAARADREDVIAGVGEAGAQLLGCGRGLDLLLHVATLIGQLDDELCHGRLTGCTRQAQPEILEELLQTKGNSHRVYRHLRADSVASENSARCGRLKVAAGP